MTIYRVRSGYVPGQYQHSVRVRVPHDEAKFGLVSPEGANQTQRADHPFISALGPQKMPLKKLLQLSTHGRDLDKEALKHIVVFYWNFRRFIRFVIFAQIHKLYLNLFERRRDLIYSLLHHSISQSETS